jgi:hypothetical protein
MHALGDFGFGNPKLRDIYGGTVSANARIARLAREGPSGQWQPRGLLQLGWLLEVGVKSSGTSQESNGRLVA